MMLAPAACSSRAIAAPSRFAAPVIRIVLPFIPASCRAAHKATILTDQRSRFLKNGPFVTLAR